MSLDVYLRTIKTCPHCNQPTGETEEVFSANITHNLNKMAEAVGLYGMLWYPKPGTFAKDLILTLEVGIRLLKKSPDLYKQFDAPNGWGTYAQFIPWLESYLEACKKYPGAVVEVSR